MKKILSMTLSAGLLTLTGCSVFGNRSQYEGATHSSLNTDGDIELREYEPLVVVQTTIEASHKDAGNAAFRKLFKYISGLNETQEKIAMTTPVFSEEHKHSEVFIEDSLKAENEAWQYAFVLPASYTLESAPQPKDAKVTLAEIPAGRAAVIRYSGRWDDGLRDSKTVELREWIEKEGLEEVSAPRYAAYDPPWTLPAMRRNEVIIEVK